MNDFNEKQFLIITGIAQSVLLRTALGNRAPCWWEELWANFHKFLFYGRLNVFLRRFRGDFYELWQWTAIKLERKAVGEIKA